MTQTNKMKQLTILFLFITSTMYSQVHPDDVRHPDNQPFVVEVAFNQDVLFEDVTQLQFNHRYIDKYLEQGEVAWTHYTFHCPAHNIQECYQDSIKFIKIDENATTIAIKDNTISVIADVIRDQRDEPAYFTIIDYEIKSDNEDIIYTCVDYQGVEYSIYIEGEDGLIYIKPNVTDDMILIYSVYHYIP